MSHSSVVAEAEIETMSQVPLGGLAYETRNFRGAPGVMSGLARPVGLHSPPLAVDSQGLLDIGGCKFVTFFRMAYREDLSVGSQGQERLYLCSCHLKQTVVFYPLCCMKRGPPLGTSGVRWDSALSDGCGDLR